MALPSIMEQDPNMPAYTPNHNWHSRRGGSTKDSGTFDIALTDMPAQPPPTELPPPPTELPPRPTPSSTNLTSKKLPINFASLNPLKKTPAMTAKEASPSETYGSSASLEGTRAERIGRSKFNMSPRTRRWLCLCTPVLMIIIGIAIGISFLMLHLNKKHDDSDDTIARAWVKMDDGRWSLLSDAFPDVDLDRILPNIHLDGYVEQRNFTMHDLTGLIDRHYRNLKEGQPLPVVTVVSLGGATPTTYDDSNAKAWLQARIEFDEVDRSWSDEYTTAHEGD